MSSIPHFDPKRFYLGSICKNGHDWKQTGRGLRYLVNNTCVACSRARHKQITRDGFYRRQWEEHKQLVDSIKLERGCVDCGYSEHPAALHFDHLPGTEKTYHISQMSSKPLEALMDEVEKCEVVCANCHAIRTAERHTTYFKHES